MKCGKNILFFNMCVSILNNRYITIGHLMEMLDMEVRDKLKSVRVNDK